MDYPGLPILDYVILVEGLTTNHINFIQLCDQELCVNFNKQKYIIDHEGY